MPTTTKKHNDTPITVSRYRGLLDVIVKMAGDVPPQIQLALNDAGTAADAASAASAATDALLAERDLPARHLLNDSSVRSHYRASDLVAAQDAVVDESRAHTAFNAKDAIVLTTISEWVSTNWLMIANRLGWANSLADDLGLQARLIAEETSAIRQLLAQSGHATVMRDDQIHANASSVTESAERLKHDLVRHIRAVEDAGVL
jgi:hypothetical protein